MTGEVIVSGLKGLYYNVDEGLFGDVESSVIIVSTSSEPKMRYIDRFYSNLVLNYDDVIRPDDPYAYTEQMAERVASVVRDVEKSDAITSLYVVCDFGESRSAAIAAAAIRYLGGDDLYLWDSAVYHPNPLVYRRTCAALGIEVTDLDIGYLLEINKKTFDEAHS